jgi:hypothetical protein
MCITSVFSSPEDTEIDWIAYMQEVQGFEDGERNYFNLKGALTHSTLLLFVQGTLHVTPTHTTCSLQFLR